MRFGLVFLVVFLSSTNIVWTQPSDSTKNSENESEKKSWSTIEYNNLSLTLYGRFVGEAIFTTDATSTRSFILYALDRTAERAPQSTITGQSTTIGLKLVGPKINSWQTGGNLSFDFHGSRPSLNEAGAYLLNAYAEIANESWLFRFGAQEDLIAPLNPIMVNWTTSQAAGNLGGTYRGHFRVDYFINKKANVRWQFSAAISQAVVNDKIEDERGIVQDNGLPNFIGRIGLEAGEINTDGKMSFEIGISGIYTQLASAIQTGTEKYISDANALALDIRWEGNRFGLRSEVFFGKGMGTHMGGIGQSVNLVTAESIHTKGGFGQVWFRPIPKIMISVIYGIDDPDNLDLSANQRSLNILYGANIFIELFKNFEFALELGRWSTDYMAPSVSNHVYVANTRFQYSF
jgi:hypothetical protein